MSRRPPDAVLIRIGGRPVTHCDVFIHTGEMALVQALLEAMACECSVLSCAKLALNRSRPSAWRRMGKWRERWCIRGLDYNQRVQSLAGLLLPS